MRWKHWMPCPKLGLGKFDHPPIQCGFQVASWDTARLDSECGRFWKAQLVMSILAVDDEPWRQLQDAFLFSIKEKHVVLF
jgi:hypothetical protein